jgi:hypothetical protein
VRKEEVEGCSDYTFESNYRIVPTDSEWGGVFGNPESVGSPETSCVVKDSTKFQKRLSGRKKRNEPLVCRNPADAQF